MGFYEQGRGAQSASGRQRLLLSSLVAKPVPYIQGVDLRGFAEVQDDAAASQFETAAEDGESANLERVTGTTGGGDRLVIVYHAICFEKVRHFELYDINPNSRVRPPLVARLHNRAIGHEFLCMVNRLYRSNNAARHQQRSSSINGREVSSSRSSRWEIITSTDRCRTATRIMTRATTT